MTFPEDALDIEVHLDLDGDEVYETDISQYVMVRNSNGRITIRRGARSEAGQTEPGSCEFTLNNRDGRFSPRNPLGPYYGQIGRNTGIQLAVHAGDSYLRVPRGPVSPDYVTTPDAAVLDITGDIDVRIDVTPDTPTASGSQELCGKGNFSAQRSWLLLLRDGKAHFEWSTDGTGGTITSVDSTVNIPIPPSRRFALRVTLDVNNGASGNTTTFYTAPTIDGPWTQLGDPVVNSGTTSIFNSNEPLTVGMSWLILGFPSAIGNYHAFELRNGINGTLVANPDFRIQTPGATSFADTASSPRTWSRAGTASITNKKVRFTGEVTGWPREWDNSGNDVWVNVEAAGIVKRLGAGARPFESTLRRKIPSTSNLLAYWPMEDREGATVFASPVPGVRPLVATGWTKATEATLVGSKPLPTIVADGVTQTYISGRVPAPASATTQWHVEFMYNIDSVPGSNSGLLRFAGTGTVAQWEIMVRTDTFHLNGFDSDGTVIVNWDHNVVFPNNVLRGWNRCRLIAEQNGGNVDWYLVLITVDASSEFSTSSYAGTVGRINAISGGQPYYGTGLNGTSIGHIAVWSQWSLNAFNYADHGHSGETAQERFARVCGEESVPYEAFDAVPDQTSELMGPQPIDTLLGVVRDCETSDHGLLFEGRDNFRLAYRDRWSLVNQHVKSTFDYEDDLMPGILPVDDDQLLKNDITAQNFKGSSARHQVTEGRLSVNAPPNGVGPYPDQIDVNIDSDDRLDDHSGWAAHLGTYDDARFPAINFDLAARSGIIEDVIRLDVGDRLQITGTPPKLSYDGVDVLLNGYTETIQQFAWEYTANCRPAVPWTTGVLDDDELGRADTDGSTLATGITSTATTMDVWSTDLHGWTRDAADFPFDVAMGGERLTVTAITGSGQDDFSDTQSNTWANADVGGAWTNAGGSANDYDKAGGVGTHTMTSVNVSRRSTLTAPLANLDVIVDIAVSATATGDSITAGLMVRVAGADDLYTARLAFTTTSTLVLSLRERAASVETQLATFTSAITYAPGTFYRLRFKAEGTSLMARVWERGRTEPLVWQVTATDATLTTANAYGVRSILGAANTNVNPVISFDNFQALNPSRWTVTRSVNGVVKAQTADTDVRLFQPTITAL